MYLRREKILINKFNPKDFHSFNNNKNNSKYKLEASKVLKAIKCYLHFIKLQLAITFFNLHNLSNLNKAFIICLLNIKEFNSNNNEIHL